MARIYTTLKTGDKLRINRDLELTAVEAGGRMLYLKLTEGPTYRINPHEEIPINSARIFNYGNRKKGARNDVRIDLSGEHVCTKERNGKSTELGTNWDRWPGKNQ